MTIGMMVCVQLLCSIPLYTDGLMNLVLIKQIKEFQELTGKYPGDFIVETTIYSSYSPARRKELFNELDDFFSHDVPPRFGLPLSGKVVNPQVGYLEMDPADPGRKSIFKTRKVIVETFSDINRHVRIVEGRFPSSVVSGNVIEVMVTEEALFDLQTVLGNEFVLTNAYDTEMEPLKVRLVGTFEPVEEETVYWFKPFYTLKNSLIVDYELFFEKFASQGACYITDIQWYIPFECNLLNPQNIGNIINAFDYAVEYGEENKGRIPYYRVNAPLVGHLVSFFEKERQLKFLLLSLYMPVLSIIFFFLAMFSFLIINSEKNEIAVLKSRGASTLQVLFVYLVEGFAIGIISVLAGFPLSLLMTRFLGTTRGFLEFVKRKSLSIAPDTEAASYALVAAIVCVIMMMIPAYMESRISIVISKVQRSRQLKKPFWHRYFVDILLIGISIYGIISFNRLQKSVASNMNALDATLIDPIIFLSATFLCIGITLLFLRFYPICIDALLLVGKRFCSPSAYLALISTGRSPRQSSYIMVFLSLMMATGVFSANAARTINSNVEDRIRYMCGTDIIIKPGGHDIRTETRIPGIRSPASGGSSYSWSGVDEPVQLPVETVRTLPGVKEATEVYRSTDARIYFKNSTISPVVIMGIMSDEFGRVSWYRRDLLPYHWYNYLNLLASEPSAALVSETLSRDFGIKKGDRISVTWSKDGYAQFIVFGFFKYWPSWRPESIWSGSTAPSRSDQLQILLNSLGFGKKDSIKTNTQAREETNGLGLPPLIVANLPYVKFAMSNEPCEIWIKKDALVPQSEILKGINEKSLKITEIKDCNYELVKSRTGEFRMAVNGSLTVGFCITVSIGIIGFAIYMVLLLKERALQFGMLRAIGLYPSNLVTAVIWEQVLTSITAMFIGFLTGEAASRLYVPLFQISFDKAEQVLPFRVISAQYDRLKLLGVAGIIVVLAVGIVWFMFTRIKISEIIKLGEE